MKKRHLNVKMTFSAGAEQQSLKTTIMKNGNVVNPATLTQGMLEFCARIAANKARALKNTIVGFTGSDISISLPEGVDMEKLEEIVQEEVADQLDDVNVDIELETEESDYIQEFSATTIEELVDENLEQHAIATEETEEAAVTETETLVIAEEAVETIVEAAPVAIEDAGEPAGLTKNVGPEVVVFSAKTANARTAPKPATTQRVSIFASADKTTEFRGQFLGKLKEGK